MFIQLQPQYLTIWELELELPAVELRVVLKDDAVVVGADDNDVGRVVVPRTGEVVDMVSLYHAVAIVAPNALTAKCQGTVTSHRCKPLFPQELQSPQGLAARKRMRLPIFHLRYLYGVGLLVIFV